MRLKIIDSYWKVKLITRDQFNAEFESGEALTDTDGKTVYFIKGAVNENVVRHEIFHVYFSHTLITSSDLTMDQTEEVAAELIGKYGKDIIEVSDKLYKRLMKQGGKP